MRRAFVVAAVSSFVYAVAACSGSSPDPIPSDPGGSNGGVPGSDASGGSSGTSGSSGTQCGPCDPPPPHPSCKGTDPCGCGPYTCSDGGQVDDAGHDDAGHDDAGHDDDAGPDSGVEPDAGAGDACEWGAANTCGPGRYCRANNCGKGRCVPIGLIETTTKGPVCGCDGVTYWNETVAAKHGMSVRQKGECSGVNAVTCGGFVGTNCPGSASCALRVKTQEQCSVADLPGICWQLPATCPLISIGHRTRACDSRTCSDECGLIRSSTPYFEDNDCPL